MRNTVEIPLPYGTLPGRRSLGVIALWFVAIAAANAAGAFEAGPDRPPLALLLAIVLPPLLFTIGLALSPAFRDWVLALDLRLLTATQCWRVIGGSFVALEAQGVLPPLFAYPAGYGDLFVGGFALVALIGIDRALPAWRERLLWLNVAGLIDFAAAVGTGVLAGDGPLGLLHGAVTTAPLLQFPLYFIPTFAVPFWIMIHIASLLQLRRLRAGAAAPGLRHATA